MSSYFSYLALKLGYINKTHAHIQKWSYSWFFILPFITSTFAFFMFTFFFYQIYPSVHFDE